MRDEELRTDYPRTVTVHIKISLHRTMMTKMTKKNLLEMHGFGNVVFEIQITIPV